MRRKGGRGERERGGGKDKGSCLCSFVWLLHNVLSILRVFTLLTLSCLNLSEPASFRYPSLCINCCAEYSYFAPRRKQITTAMSHITTNAECSRIARVDARSAFSAHERWYHMRMFADTKSATSECPWANIPHANTAYDVQDRRYHVGGMRACYNISGSIQQMFGFSRGSWRV